MIAETVLGSILGTLHQPDKSEIKIFRFICRYGKNLKTTGAKRKIRLNKKQLALFKQRIPMFVKFQ